MYPLYQEDDSCSPPELCFRKVVKFATLENAETRALDL